MNKFFLFVIIFTGVLISAGCDKKITATPSNPQFRIFNATPWTFYNCIVDPEGTLSDNPGINAYYFGQVNVNVNTLYKSFPKLYRYSWVRLVMNNKTYYLKPYDYTGETPLETGWYTYKLTYNSTNDQLGLELIKD